MLKLGGHRGSYGCCFDRDIPNRICAVEDKDGDNRYGQASKEQVADMLKRMLHIPRVICCLLWMQQMGWLLIVVFTNGQTDID